MRGEYISGVFLGFRDEPHLIVARKVVNEKTGKSFVIRATLDTAQFNSILSSIDLPGGGDAFIVDHAGVIQTPSKRHGSLLSKLALPIPAYSEKTSVNLAVGENGGRVYYWVCLCPRNAVYCFGHQGHGSVDEAA